MSETIQLTPEQQKAIEHLEECMKNLFGAFALVDLEGLQITDALEMIGMEVPLFARPAVNQLSGRLKEMREEAESGEVVGE